MLFTLLKVAFELGIVCPDLNAKAMLSIFNPITDELSTVTMFICPFAMGFIIDPITFVNVAISVDQAAFSIRFIILPIANKF
jgi:hypothetical protein